MRTVKITCMLLVCCIVVGLCGCSRNTGEKKTEGAQYFEYEMKLPEGVEADCIVYMGANPEGHLRILAYNQKHISVYTYQDEEWKQEILDVFDKEPVQQVRGCFYGEDGLLYFFAKDVSGKKPFVLCRSKDGKDYEEVRLEQYPTDEFGTCEAYKYGVTEQGDIVLCFQNRPGIYVYDSTGKEKKRITKDLEPTVCGSTIYGTSASYGYLKSYDAENEYKAQLLGDTPKTIYGVTEDTDGNMYYVDSLGIHKRRIGGSAKQLLAEGQLGQMSGSECAVTNMAVVEGRIYVLYSQSDVGAQLCEYRFEERELEEAKELSIYSLTENNTIEQAVRLFNREHPSYKIQYTWGMRDNTDGNISEEVEKMNAQITDGETPDVLILDNVLSEYYAQQGLLWNLDEWLEEKTQSGEYYNNILTAEEYDGHHYVVPMKFGVAFGFGTEKYGEDAQEIAEAIQKNKTDESFLGAIKLEQCAAFFLRKDAVPTDKEALIRELEAIKVITDHSRAMDDYNMLMLYDKKEDYSVAGYDDEVFARQQIFDVLEEGRQQYFCGETKNPYGIMTYHQAAQNNGTQLVAMDQTFYPHCRVAISEKAKDKELALEFLNCLLSEELQKESGMDGFPVNKEATKQCIQKFMQKQDDSLGSPSMMIGGSAKSYQVDAYTQEEAEEILRLFGELNHCVVNDAEYYRILADEAKPYLEDKISAEQAAENMIRKSNELGGR